MFPVTTGLHDQVASRHSVLFSMFFGPLGLLSHLVTQVSTCTVHLTPRCICCPTCNVASHAVHDDVPDSVDCHVMQ